VCQVRLITKTELMYESLWSVMKPLVYFVITRFYFHRCILNAGLISLKPMLQLWMAAPFTLGFQMELGSTFKQVCGVPLAPTPPFCIVVSHVCLNWPSSSCVSSQCLVVVVFTVAMVMSVCSDWITFGSVICEAQSLIKLIQWQEV